MNIRLFIPLIIVTLVIGGVQRAYADSLQPSTLSFGGMVFDVVGQNGDIEFVSQQPNTVTFFLNASWWDSTGLLAHDYLAGQYFYSLQIGNLVELAYDGYSQAYQVVDIREFETTPGGLREVGGDGSLYSEDGVFDMIYLEDILVLQTCLANGYYFVIATQLCPGCPFPTPTDTPTPTSTKPFTPTPTETPTDTPSPTATFTDTPTSTATFTNTPTSTSTATATATATSTMSTPTNTPTITTTITPTKSATPTKTFTPTPTNTPFWKWLPPSGGNPEYKQESIIRKFILWVNFLSKRIPFLIGNLIREHSPIYRLHK